ncbi:polyprenyl synthetase family protein [Corynebacterium gerontici]|uniref:(2E,6E)-farnesyl diphosphate synthase n=1 Tax=Corynebacterium gerontici TaxID=2079234 RepID=A0A3G6J184_9CORY|nr:polyprenyl synthetase family protein [Corynebacterium gerontici]AZA11781.1 (2E,6E)-farnesyl diphosphate synthase [Corynebacterium gerontici]
MAEANPSAEALNLSRLVEDVEQTLRQYFELRQPELERIGPPAVQAVDFLRSLVFGGGKRIRPAYTVAGFLAAGGTTNADAELGYDALLQVASAFELIQACALAHDDVIDASDTRRGQATIHRAAEAHHRENGWHGESAHFGESVAILAGDLALAWADDMFSTADVSPQRLVDALQAWRCMRTEVIGGQLLDIFLESEGSESLELANNVNRFKSAAYTIERPLHVGACLAGGSPEIIRVLRQYGRDIGIAFQLRDDLLGVFGDPAKTGKPAGDDLREGKRTVLVTRAIQLSTEAGDAACAAMIREQVGNVNDPEQIQALAQHIKETGAVEEVEQHIDELTDRGIASLDAARQLGAPAEAMALLEVLTELATARKF